MMNKEVLMITGIEGAGNLAAAIGEQLDLHVEVAATRKAALTSLKHGEFGVVIVEENMAAMDPDWANHVWAHAGQAIPLEINFAISGVSRLTREVRSALDRMKREQLLARRSVALEMENDLKVTVTGMLLQSELALREPAVSPTLEPKLRRLVELAGVMRERLRVSAA
ncbi:hypothetical protein [Granulicella tundricola]|uniref:Uncharacterized protein n=1 Tax=Granulicella tundricola (strain ATCC BAA-1859 / DSM 23138 / MP5ACTX9) TaxID=1198114 RepID=E8X5H1_GRATM|nr:hypothetical protein [Granulicella tundricola]ADW69518.1 hypothetical protein AciX9_2485 [Granulicella tundricola MP5ACTX9]